MGGKGNIKNLTVKSSAQARELGRIGGTKSGEVKRARKTLKEELLLLLSEDNNQNRMSIALLQKAIKRRYKSV